VADDLFSVRDRVVIVTGGLGQLGSQLALRFNASERLVGRQFKLGHFRVRQAADARDMRCRPLEKIRNSKSEIRNKFEKANSNDQHEAR